MTANLREIIDKVLKIGVSCDPRTCDCVDCKYFKDNCADRQAHWDFNSSITCRYCYTSLSRCKCDSNLCSCYGFFKFSHYFTTVKGAEYNINRLIEKIIDFIQSFIDDAPFAEFNEYFAPELSSNGCCMIEFLRNCINAWANHGSGIYDKIVKNTLAAKTILDLDKLLKSVHIFTTFPNSYLIIISCIKYGNLDYLEYYISNFPITETNQIYNMLFEFDSRFYPMLTIEVITRLQKLLGCDIINKGIIYLFYKNVIEILKHTKRPMPPAPAIPAAAMPANLHQLIHGPLQKLDCSFNISLDDLPTSLDYIHMSNIPKFIDIRDKSNLDQYDSEMMDNIIRDLKATLLWQMFVWYLNTFIKREVIMDEIQCKDKKTNYDNYRLKSITHDLQKNAPNTFSIILDIIYSS